VPVTPPPPEECEQFCLVILKFLDKDGDGIHDPDEPMLEGIPFELTVRDEVHVRETGAGGEIWFCLRESETVGIREVTRALGGTLVKTTTIPETWSIGCGAAELWIGNMYLLPPPTGGGPGGAAGAKGSALAL
jgi:hypothetical protein